MKYFIAIKWRSTENIKNYNIYYSFIGKIEIMRRAIKEIIRIVFKRVKNRFNET